MTSVLFVEDDAEVAQPLAAALRREGYCIDVRDTGSDALDAVHAAPYELVILDLGLPDIDGLEVCREIRRRLPDLPVLMLTARADEVDVVVGLDAGADDYLTKPFRLAELLARMRALMRRNTSVSDIEVNRLRIEPAARRAWMGESPLELSAKEFDLLALLARNMSSVVDRAQIVRDVWAGTIPESSRSIDTHISALRRTLAAGDESIRLSTIRGIGFRLELA